MAYAIADIIGWAKEAQILSLIGELKKKKTVGGNIDADLHIKLYVERKTLEWAYAQDPTDTELFKQANYVFALCGIYGIKAMSTSGCVPPSISVDPTNQTPIIGGSTTFTVVVSGSNISYQWQFNNSNISGAVSSSYTISSVSLGDVGDYKCIVSNSCGSAESASASLTIGTGALVGYYWYGSTDYRADLLAGVDNITYLGTFPIVDGEPLDVPFPVGASDNVYNITKYPENQSVKTSYDNHTPVVGFIPDSNYENVVSFGGFRYVFSRVEMSLNSAFTMIYT